MRFIHIADTHLGMQPDKGYQWSQQRERMLWKSFFKILDICREEEPELLLIAGDMFHRQPYLKELREVDAAFASIPKTRVVIIAGNHDYISAASKYSGYSWSGNVTFFLKEEVDSVYFEDINTEIYGLSFCHRQIHANLLDDITISHPDRINILLMHGGEPSNLPVERKLLLNKGFDYIACGHLHTPTTVSETMRYPGCLEPLEKNDIGERGFIRGEISECERTLNTSFEAFSRCRYFKPEVEVTSEISVFDVRAKIAEIILKNGKDNIYTFTLIGRRDPEISFDTEILREEGNILEIKDMTSPDYDYERLLKDNRGNIIGRYIERIRSLDVEDALRDKALEYGITALLKEDGSL